MNLTISNNKSQHNYQETSFKGCKFFKMSSFDEYRKTIYGNKYLHADDIIDLENRYSNEKMSRNILIGLVCLVAYGGCHVIASAITGKENKAKVTNKETKNIPSATKRTAKTYNATDMFNLSDATTAKVRDSLNLESKIKKVSLKRVITK